MGWLFRATEPWASLYSAAPMVQVLMVFAHLAGMLVAGGFAMATDRGILAASAWSAEERTRRLADLRSVHRPVLAGLAVTLASGLLMLAADLETYLGSPAFWTKMVLLGLLLYNGHLVRKAGSARVGEDAGAAWRRLRGLSMASIALWLAVLLAGTVLATT